MMMGVAIFAVWMFVAAPTLDRSAAMKQQRESIRQLLQQTKLIPEPQASANSDAAVAVSAKFPRLNVDQPAQRLIDELLQLGAKFQVQTTQLQSTRNTETLATAAFSGGASIGQRRPEEWPNFKQQVFTWHFQGKATDVLSLLERLAAAAMSIQQLSIQQLSIQKPSIQKLSIEGSPKQTLDEAGQVHASNAAIDGWVQASLTFRQYFIHAVPVGAEADVDWDAAHEVWAAPRAKSAVDKHLFSAMSESSSCSYLAGKDSVGETGNSALLLGHNHINTLSLVGVLEDQDSVAGPRLQAILRSDGGKLAVLALPDSTSGAAAVSPRVSAQGYQLVMLNRYRAVLRAPELNEVTSVGGTDEQPLVVLPLRPRLSEMNSGLAALSSVGDGR